jgi:hypothetical protein
VPLVPLPLTAALTVAVFAAVALTVTAGCEMLTAVRIKPGGGGGGVSTTTVVLTLPELAPEAALALSVTTLLTAAELTVPDRLQVQVAD